MSSGGSEVRLEVEVFFPGCLVSFRPSNHSHET